MIIIKPKTGKCVHCLIEFNELTWDHVFPKAWYPDDVTIEGKWKVPACKECNNKLSRIEKELWLAFGISHGDMKNIYQKIRRSIDCTYAKNEKDKIARKQAKEALMRKIKLFDRNTEGCFPNIDNRDLYPENVNKILGIEISDVDIKKFTEKIIRGITYIVDNKYITTEYDIDTYIVKEDNIDSSLDDLWMQADIYKKPGIEIKRVTDVSEKAALYRIVIWDKIIIYGSVIIKE